MELVARLDEYGQGAWIAVMVLAFIVFWPIGLAILAYLIWSGRMGCWGKGGPGRWYNTSARSGRAGWWSGEKRRQSSGNSAFDEYREEMLRRLEDEQQEFMEFLDRLRQAKDKSEFDQFMADRKRRGPRSEGPDPSQGPSGGPNGDTAPQPGA